MPASATEAAVRAAFARQAGWAKTLGSPFMERLCALLGERLSRDTEVGRRVLGWPDRADPFSDALPLRLAGGLHALVRAGRAPQLAALYPPKALPNEDPLWAALEPVLGDPALLPWLESAPQTNEVGRSAPLMAGLLVVAERFEQPVELLELGASAGLNLHLDRYRYDLGGRPAGDPASPLRLAPDWEGPPPPDAEVRVASRRGVDINPLDPRRDGNRLLAYVWPDQIRRLAQLEAALAVAAGHPAPVDRGDAAGWLESRLAERQHPGTTRVVLHSIAFQYFPAESKARIVAALAEAGKAAGARSPLAWLRYEFDAEDRAVELRLTTWPGGERLLARGHPHGAALSWIAAPAR
ncbi:MAG: DUF2332 family protein [Alphaproteobacteria bacterium]|nr:DUF2332 family protein [Alphaproteobacteria bacterium]MBV9370704.1 DUF2332 family protein [Alphaproteobacteria bacterium]MBV9899883.1 DUF2332 family protein [Alphaproteobacteria bacterium]